MNVAVFGTLARCRCLPVAPTSSRTLCAWASRPIRPASGRRLLYATNNNLAESAKSTEPVNPQELAKLLKGFEESTGSEKSDTTTSATLSEPQTLDSSPRKPPRKSRIEDYSAWHQWDGESDKVPTVHAPLGTGEVDRYISDVLSDVAKAKAARDEAEREDKEVQQGLMSTGSDDLAQEKLQRITQSEKTTVENENSVTFASTVNSPTTSTLSETAASSLSSKQPQRRKLQKADMAALAKKLQLRLDKEIERLKVTKELVRASLTSRAKDFGRDAQVQLGMLGGKVNEVTGYNEIERLKQDVRERENDIARLREQSARAKDAYDQAVTSRSVSQRDLNALLERKHSWTDADISHFTHLVRSDHNLNHAVSSSKEALKRAESEVDKAFTALLKSILERYHEEQVWSDKIRSVSTYGSLIVLLMNLIVFLGAIAIVEPWKRKRLVRGLEERVKGMVEDVEHTVTGEFEEVKRNMASVAATLAELQAAMGTEAPTPFSKIADTTVPPATTARPVTLSRQSSTGSDNQVWAVQSASTSAVLREYTSIILPPSTLQHISRVSTQAASYLAEQDPRKVDMAITGTVGLFAGAVVTLLFSASH
ncbi:hypothetical protein QFC22_001012 [Naganishia vaughanmartiniae]|uniref:Uncharacterized protein n=1 Tax=Naganishia vaughanmartiniae TaxID=1424756 RepID=A0ACC2XLG9_9TREE|nr:hypothetical protein QFC22_001012 [Naganishia vaughanmartiniae]